MKKCIALLMALCVLLLAGCRSSAGTEDNAVLNPGQSVAETTTPEETENTQTQPQETEPDSSAALAEFNDLFGNLGGWYNRTLTSLYTSPEQLDLQLFFYRGFDTESQTPTDEEWAELEGLEGFDINYDLIRLPGDKMNEVLEAYFGVTLEDMSAESFEGLTYLESTGCYYFMTTDFVGAEDFAATGMEVLENGTIRLYYTLGGVDAYVVTLKPNGDGYMILANEGIQ